MIAGIILAAGEGKRYGKPKALATLKDKTFLESQYELLKEFCAPLIVVVGAESNTIKKEHRHLYIGWCDNMEWQYGQFSSIQSGLKYLSQNIAAIILPVDVLNVKKETIKDLIKTYNNNNEAEAIIPSYDKKNGHPIILSPTMIKKIINLPSDMRLDNILRSSNQIKIVDVDDKSILSNINTSEDL